MFDEDIIYERETRERKERGLEVERTRRRSLSAPRRRYTENDLEAEAEYYNRKAAERAYIGEAYNGATRDWAIVDVPPGTNRVRMDGVGGGSQEITWQRYNGVRRSKFITEDEEFTSDFGRAAPAKPKSADMWTEITKDLVMKEAIETMGFDYEETDYFFYVMEYLRYVSFPNFQLPRMKHLLICHFRRMFSNSLSSRMRSVLTGALASARSIMREKRSVSGDRSTTTTITNMKSRMTADAAGTDERDNINHYDNGQFSILHPIYIHGTFPHYISSALLSEIPANRCSPSYGKSMKMIPWEHSDNFTTS